MRFAAFVKIYQILKLKFLKFDKILQNLRHLQFFLLKFHENCCFFKPIFCENFEIAAVQKYANLVELEKCCRTHIFLQNFVLIQPRTSPPKICKNCAKFTDVANFANPNPCPKPTAGWSERRRIAGIKSRRPTFQTRRSCPTAFPSKRSYSTRLGKSKSGLTVS